MLNPLSYKTFFYQIQIASVGGLNEMNTFKYGDSARIIESQRSETTYPVLWAELPEYRYVYHQGGFIKTLTGAFIVAKDFALDDYDGQDSYIDDALKTCEWILLEMKLAGYIKEGDSFSADPIQGNLADNLYGYRVEFQIKNNDISNFC